MTPALSDEQWRALIDYMLYGRTMRLAAGDEEPEEVTAAMSFLVRAFQDGELDGRQIQRTAIEQLNVGDTILACLDERNAAWWTVTQIRARADDDGIPTGHYDVWGVKGGRHLWLFDDAPGGLVLYRRKRER